MADLFPTIASLGSWNWLILAAVLLAAEIVAPGFFLLWFGIAAIAVGLIAFSTDLAWHWEVLIFGLFSVAAFVIGRRYFRPMPGDTDKPHLNQRLAQYVGQTYPLATEIDNGRGKVRIGDTLWPIEGDDLKDGLPVGTKVRITGTRGMILVAEIAESGR